LSVLHTGNAGAEVAGQLDGEGADAPASADHHDPLLRPDPTAVAYRL
jgi:hypothetical protein